MMNCPLCQHAAHTRSSVQITKQTKERYNQCQNINCGCTFKSHETVADIIMNPGENKSGSTASRRKATRLSLAIR